MATAVNHSARPVTVIRMGASSFTLTATRPPFPAATRDVNAEIKDRFGPATFDRQRRKAREVTAYLGQLAASICHAHGIGIQTQVQRTRRKDRRPPKPQAERSAAIPMSM